ncbi:amidase [Actinomadura sp. B10D3]|uniref:amidase n=1 Tax=Actinomadura sp. B10D3 TaxID=3153557 RepID=UPI00325D8D82
MNRGDRDLIWPALDIDGAVALLRSGRVEGTEVAAAHRRRAAALDRTLNVSTELLPPGRQNSRAVSPDGITLRDIPIAVKDNLAVRDSPLTAGCAALDPAPQNADATVVRRLRRRGADLVMRTNLDELALGGMTTNPLHGRTLSPWDKASGVGGSSGGSAAAVAAGMCMAAIGTDTGGSVRNPAALCGVVGYKPSYGAVDTAGVLPLAWSLDTVGILSHTAQDALLVFLAIVDDRFVGTDRDRMAWSRRFATAPSRRPRIGVVQELFDSAEEPTHKEFARALERLEAVADLGEVQLARLDDSLVATQLIVAAEAASAFRVPAADRWSKLGDAVRELLEAGGRLSAADYLDAQRLRRSVVDETAGAVDGFDAVISPTTGFCPGPAALAAAGLGGGALWRLATRYTCLWNLTGSPVAALPCGFTDDGFPLSLQIACPPGRDLHCLRVAKLIEGALGIDRSRLEPTWVRTHIDEADGHQARRGGY